MICKTSVIRTTRKVTRYEGIKRAWNARALQCVVILRQFMAVCIVVEEDAVLLTLRLAGRKRGRLENVVLHPAEEHAEFFNFFWVKATPCSYLLPPR